MKRFEPNEQRREDIKSIAPVIEKAPDGARMSWVEVESASGVKMDPRGRGLFRHCADKLNRPYLTLPGLGVEFSSSGNAIEIAKARVTRVRHSIGRLQETTELLVDKHAAQMSTKDKATLIAIRSQKATLDLVRSLKA